MPEMTMTVRWPAGRVEDCSSREQLGRSAAAYGAEALVEVLAMHPPLPRPGGAA